MSNEEKKTSKSKLHELRHKDSNPYMQETDPRNPFGPNYEDLPYDTKVYYKFNKVRKYVHMDKEDQEKIIWNNYEFLGGTSVVTALCMGLGYGIRYLMVEKYHKGYSLLTNYSNIYYGLFFSAGITTAYYYYTDVYMKDIVYPMLDKYLD